METDDQSTMWGRKELAEFLGLSEHTIRTYVTSHPERLPPRVGGFRRSRWLKTIVLQWAAERSGCPAVPGQGAAEKNAAAARVAPPSATPMPKARRGRPRLPPP